MGITGLIAGAKKSFKEYRSENKSKRMSRELQAYEKEKAQLEKQNRELSADKQRRDTIERLRSSNAKLKPESKLKSMGKGLAKVINKGKEGVQSAKKQGFLSGAKFEPGKSTFGGSGSQGSPFGGSRNLEVGGNSGNFNTSRGLQFGKAEPEKKEKPRAITIKVT